MITKNLFLKRVKELFLLEDGWHDGEGLAPVCLDVFSDYFMHFKDKIPLLYLYPTIEGNISAEWDFSNQTLTCDINAETGDCEFLVINSKYNDFIGGDINIYQSEGINRLIQIINIGNKK